MINVQYQVSNKIRTRINKVIYEIINTFIEMGENDGFDFSLAAIFPSYLLRTKEDNDECQNVIYDLRDYANDKYIHDLSPKYQYALFNLIDWYIELNDNNYETIVDASFLIPILEEDKYFIDNLNNLEEYKDFMFEDWDFLHIDDYVRMYYEMPNQFQQYGIDLREYLSLMPKDIRLKYMELENYQSNISNLKEIIITTIFTAIIFKERNPKRLQNMSETQLSDDIADILNAGLNKKGIISAREHPMGFALKEPGELDFFIYSNLEGVIELSIGENKEWGNFEKQIEQLLGYMNERIEFGFTIIFNKSTQLKTVLNRRKEILTKFCIENEKGRNFETIDMVADINQMESVLLTKHINPENGKIFELYHFVCNAYRPEREEAAKQARKK